MVMIIGIDRYGDDGKNLMLIHLMTTNDITFFIAVVIFGPSMNPHNEYLGVKRTTSGHKTTKSAPTPINCEKYSNVKNQFVRTKTIPEFDMYVHPVREDKYVSGSIIKKGAWEINQANKLSNLLKEYPKAILVDIGANITQCRKNLLSIEVVTQKIENFLQNFEI